MAAIRPLQRQDLPEVVALLRRQFPNFARDESFLEGTLLERLPAGEQPLSSVALDGDAIVGFIGGRARRLHFDDRQLSGFCVSQLAVLSEPGAAGLGAMLLARVLAGPQDLTWADSTTDLVARMWRARHGGVDNARSVDFMLVVRPGRWMANLVREGVSRRGDLPRATLPVPALPFQSAGRRLVRRAFPQRPAALSSSPASAAEIVEQLPKVSRKMRFRVDYDAAGLEHQFKQVKSLSGPLVHRIVRRGGQPIGWYAYLRRGSSPARLLHLAARDAAATADVLTELTSQAAASGVTAIAGRAEPHLHWPLRDRFAALGYGVQPVLHCSDPELRAVLSTDRSLLTELDSVDSEWWSSGSGTVVPQLDA